MAFVVRTRELTWSVPGHADDGFRYTSYLVRLHAKGFTSSQTDLKAQAFATRAEAEAALARVRSMLPKGDDDGWHVAGFAPASLTDQLAAAVRDSGLTQGELAGRSGVSQSVLSRWLAGGRDVTLKTADKIRDALIAARIERAAARRGV